VRILDLFCGAGGASKGYYRPGATIVGVDIQPQPNYPYDFVHGDAATYPLDGFDVIHASPPCQPYSTRRMLDHGDKADLLPVSIKRLRESDAQLWVVENVTQAWAPGVRHSFMLCANGLGLVDESSRRYLVRHRNIWSNLKASPPCSCKHYRQQAGWVSAGVHGGGPSEIAHGKNNQVPIELAKRLMGIDWMARAELVEALPPAYTSWILDTARARGLVQGC